jgi:hypothetical protein
MATSPYSDDGLADARAVVTDADLLATLPPLERARIIAMALTILRKDRGFREASRLQDTPTQALVLRIPRAVFEAGPKARRVTRKPRLTVHPTTPGDAA